MKDAKTESIGERCFIVKGTGDPNGGIAYCAVRTSGPYQAGDGDLIKNGTGAVANQQRANAQQIAMVFNGLQPSVGHYWGMVSEFNSTYSGIITGYAATLATPSDVGGPPRPGVPTNG